MLYIPMWPIFKVEKLLSELTLGKKDTELEESRNLEKVEESRNLEKMEESSNQIQDYIEDPLKAVEIFGLEKTRAMYWNAHLALAGTHDNANMIRVLSKNVELEMSVGNYELVQKIYKFGSAFANPDKDPDFWNQWLEFEGRHGNEDSIRELQRTKKLVQSVFRRAEEHQVETGLHLVSI